MIWRRKTTAWRRGRWSSEKSAGGRRCRQLNHSVLTCEYSRFGLRIYIGIIIIAQVSYDVPKHLDEGFSVCVRTYRLQNESRRACPELVERGRLSPIRYRSNYLYAWI